MKPRVTIKKNSSPRINNLKCKSIDNVNESVDTKKTSKTNNKPGILSKINKGIVKMIFERKARSNSPKNEVNKTIHEIIRNQLSKHNSPGFINNSMEKSRARKNIGLSSTSTSYNKIFM